MTDTIRSLRLPISLTLLAVAAASVATAWFKRTSRLERLRAAWGKPRDQERDFAAIADFFRAQDATDGSLDDRTWDDLLLDDVFASIDRGESRVGQQLLYRRLRSASAATRDAFEALVTRVTDQTPVRERTQIALLRLRDPAAYYIHRLARPGALHRSRWHVLFPIWSGTIVAALLLAPDWSAVVAAAIVAFVVNMIIHGSTGRRVANEIQSFRQVGPLLSVAHDVLPLATPDTAPITGRLRDDLRALRPLQAIARWVSRGTGGAGGELAAALLEYLNILLLLDVNALYFAGRELQARGSHLLRVIETVGEIDAAIAVASWRAGDTPWTRPRFVAADAPAVFTDVTHPLIAQAVPNSLTAAPPHGVLVTGSNMSGKSTFLRTIGVNVVLAQTVHTVLARDYAAPLYHVRSCIGRSDDLIAGKSYYLVEVESVLALVRASEHSEPHLFIFDELFRGTNAVERIAAAEAVLNALVGDGRPHIVLAATHDGELVDFLAHTYAVFHLGDAVGSDGLVFDYRLTAGPATSRNAITLLQLNGAPASLVSHAMARAASLDATRAGG